MSFGLRCLRTYALRSRSTIRFTARLLSTSTHVMADAEAPTISKNEAKKRMKEEEKARRKAEREKKEAERAAQAQEVRIP
jgi:hypothetical protein